MIQTNIVSNSNAGVTNVAMNGAAPETAGFDFMNYLLGLQTSPLDFGSTNNTGPADAKSLDALLKGALADADAEAGKSQKKELDPWSLIFPGMVPNNVPVDPNAMNATTAADIATQEGPNVSNSVDKLLAQAGFEVTPMATTSPKIVSDPKTAVEKSANETMLAPVAMPLVANASLNESAAPSGANTNARNATPGARVLRVEKFDADTVASPVAFRASGAELKTQGLLAEANNNAVSSQNTQQVAAQKYAQVARGDSDSMVAVQRNGTPEVAALANTGERRQENLDTSIVDPSAAGIPTTSSAHVAGAALNGGETMQQAAPQSVPHLFSRVESMAQQGGGRMVVLLSPPELGKVEVEVTTRGKRVEIKMTSDSSSAKSVLESGMGDLKRSLEGQNLQLAHTEVHVSKDTAQHGQFSQAFTNHQSQQQGGFQSSRDERGSQSNGGLSRNVRNPIERVDSVSARRVATPGRVDVRI